MTSLLNNSFNKVFASRSRKFGSLGMPPRAAPTHNLQRTRPLVPLLSSLLLLVLLYPHPGTAQVYCPDPPEIPDCSSREHVCTVYSGGPSVLNDGDNPYRCANKSLPDNWMIIVNRDDKPVDCDQLRSLNPDEEVFIKWEFNDCCEECCGKPPVCGFALPCDTWVGSGAEFRIEDQHGTQLNWNSAAFGGGTADGYYTSNMWDRGNSGICGNPDSLEVVGMASQWACWKASADVWRRTGWNRAGTDIWTAPLLNDSSQWCGSINEAPCGGGSGGGDTLECRPDDPPCTSDHYWQVELSPGDKVHVASKLSTGLAKQTYASLFLHDENGNRIANLRSWLVGTNTMSWFTYQHDRAAGTYYLVLNAHFPTDPDRKVNDLWEYGIGFAVERLGCAVPPATCTPPCGICESCDSGSCVPVAKGTTCDDGNACTFADACSGGVCGGAPLVCNDKNPCTVDTCDAATGCQYVPKPDGTSCGDKDFCNGEEVCTSGTCVSGSPPTIEDLKDRSFNNVNDTMQACEGLGHYKAILACAASDGSETEDTVCAGGGTTAEACLYQGVHGQLTGSYCLLYGPRTFTIPKGKARPQSVSFTSDSPKNVWLYVTNGPDPLLPVGKAARGVKVSLNGTLVMSETFGRIGIPYSAVQVSVGFGKNTLVVEPIGSTGSQVIVEISDVGNPIYLHDMSDDTCNPDTLWSVCELNCYGCL